jgi:hypothetical protein
MLKSLVIPLVSAIVLATHSPSFAGEKDFVQITWGGKGKARVNYSSTSPRPEGEWHGTTKVVRLPYTILLELERGTIVSAFGIPLNVNKDIPITIHRNDEPCKIRLIAKKQIQICE